MLLLTYIFILAIFIIVSFTLYKIFKLYWSFKEKGQASKHYPIILAIALLAIPLISKAFSFPAYLIKVFNIYTTFNLPSPKDDWTAIVFYGLYILAVVAIIYIYYKLKPTERDHSKDDTRTSKITYPDNSQVVISPFLHERIKELFELKNQKLKLSYDEKEKVLVGEYAEVIHAYRYFIYCDTSSKNISKNKQDEIYERLQVLSKEFDSTKYKPQYLLFIEEGVFEKNDNEELKCYTEDSFLNKIINFSTYLQKNIDRFDKQRTDIGGVSLHDSFIEPSFNKGQSNLKVYFDDWLEEESLRHISLLADYGMGKTSFLKYYTKYLSQKILSGESFSRYPVFISLTNTSPMSNDGIETKIKGFVSEELGVSYALFERLVHLGKIVFILDGFDEMGFIGTAKTRFEQFNSIWKLATKNNKILISGRPSYLPTDFERNNVLNIVDSDVADVQQTPYTEVIELDYFKLEEIEKTLNIYYVENKKREEYLAYIKRNRSILDLCKRPSMLHMTMSILPTLYSEDSTKVITSSDIMNKYTEYWISRQESKAIKGYFSSNDNKKKEFLINFFTELSGEMFEEGTLVISKEKLDDLIVRLVKKHHKEIESNEASFEGFKNEIYAGYFIEVDINYEKEDHFKFVHKSIFEFFVSMKIIKLMEEKKFNEKLMGMDWNSEIMDFIDGSIDHEKYKGSKYPSLIMLRDSWLDRWVLIPILTKISMYRMLSSFLVLALAFFISALVKQSKIHSGLIPNDVSITFFVLMVVVVIVGTVLIIVVCLKIISYLERQLNFIAKAYYLDKKNIMIKAQLQHFLDFYALFDKIEFSNWINKNYSNVTIRKLSFHTSSLMNIKYISSKIESLKFIDCELNNVEFSDSDIGYLKFNNTQLTHLLIKNSFVGKLFFSKNFFYAINLYIAWSSIKVIILKKRINRFGCGRHAIKMTSPKIIFTRMTLNHFDKVSLESFQNFIKNNKMKRKDIICSSSELKEVLFAKLEGRE